VLQSLDERGLDNLVLIITRFTVTEQDMAVLEQLRNVRLTLLLTYSGITDPRVEPITKSAVTSRSIATACARKHQTKVVLYWRPIVPGWNDHSETMRHVLTIGQDADAIVFTGYYHKPENAAYLRDLGVTIPYDSFDRRKVMPAELDARVITAWRDSGISTPLFRKTSCGVSAAHHVADYNGHWGIPELCDICPLAQADLCRAAHVQPADAQFRSLLESFGYDSDFLIEDGHIWTHGLGEQRRYALQHSLGYQVWELSQPHYLGAHGRSLTGHQPATSEHDQFAALRHQFRTAARFDDD
jgi:hypothetical protein